MKLSRRNKNLEVLGTMRNEKYSSVAMGWIAHREMSGRYDLRSRL